MYVYIRSEANLFTTGFYDPTGQWHPDRDFADRDAAAQRVHWLNGGHDEKPILSVRDLPEGTFRD